MNPRPAFVVTEPAPGRSLPTAITQVYEWAEPATLLAARLAQSGGASYFTSIVVELKSLQTW